MLSLRDFNKTIEWMRKCQCVFYFSDNPIRNKNIIEYASKFIPKCTCLIQAIAFKILGSSDPDIKLVIGVSNKNKFESHAWVAKNDQVVFGGAASVDKFTRLVDF